MGVDVVALRMSVGRAVTNKIHIVKALEFLTSHYRNSVYIHTRIAIK